MVQPILDRPATKPEVAPPGPPASDGLPTTNARGQIRGPAPRLEPEVEAAIRRKIAKDIAALKRAQAAELADGEVVAATGELDLVPVIGWAAALVEAGVAVYEGVQIAKLLKDIYQLEHELGESKEEDNVSVDGTPCLVDEYKELKKICGGQAHHIMPDMVYRIGARPSNPQQESSTNDRIDNAPTFNQGMAICLTNVQHAGLHSALRGKLNTLGSQQTPNGTAPMGKITSDVNASINGIPGLPQECKNLAISKLSSQTKKLGLNQPGRTQESPLPSGKAADVLRQGYY